MWMHTNCVRACTRVNRVRACTYVPVCVPACLYECTCVCVCVHECVCVHVCVSWQEAPSTGGAAPRTSHPCGTSGSIPTAGLMLV